MLTKRQKQVLDFIKSFTTKKGYAPSLEEITKHLGLSSISTVHHHVSGLEKEGFVKREKNEPRAVEIKERKEESVKIPFVGTIAAGEPIEAVENQEIIKVPKSQLSKSGKHFALRVSGNSMIKEGIFNGDIVVIRKQPTAENGETVVALINDNEVTLKKIYREKNGFRLQPANPELKPIFTKELIVQGKVISIIRTFEELKEKNLTEKGEKLQESEISGRQGYKTISKSILKRWLNTIQCMDCIEGLKKLPDHCIDLIIVDPPYWKVINAEWDYKWRTEEDYIQWCKRWLKELGRVIKKTGSFYLFGYFKTLSYLLSEIEKAGFSLRQQIIINKGIKAISGRATKNYKMFPNVTESILFFVYNDQPEIKKFLKEQQRKKRLTAKEINDLMGVKSNGGGLWSLYTGENILTQIPTKEQWDKLQKILDFERPYSEIAFTFNPQMGFTDVWSDIDFYEEKRYHPTQKPIKLIERIIKASSNERTIVLDPFMGSGSTAIAAKRLKRKFIGFEIDPNYVEIANKRLSDKNNFSVQNSLI